MQAYIIINFLLGQTQHRHRDMSQYLQEMKQTHRTAQISNRTDSFVRHSAASVVSLC